MPSRLLAIAAICALFMCLPVVAIADAQLMNGEQVEIVKIKEGEVFLGRVVETGEKIDIRLLGVDCTADQDRPAASYARSNLVGQIVTISSENPPIPPAMDQFDRWIVYLELESGADYGMELLESGNCTSKTWSMNHMRKSEYQSIEPG